MEKIKVINIPIYGGKLVVMLTNNSQFVRKYYPDFEDDYVYAHAINYTYKGNRAYYVVLNPDYKGVKVTRGVVAHEAHHIVTYLFHYKGILYDPANDEPFSYMLEWVVERIHEVLDKKVKE